MPHVRASLHLRRPLVVLLLVGTGLLAPLRAGAHTVETVDGTIYEGRIAVDNEEKVVIATTFDGRVTIPREQVKAIDNAVPPLRDQLKYRAELAKDDVGKLWDLHRWAKEKGFDKELVSVLRRILVLAPKNVRAHKLLGHEKVDGEWMTPREKEFYLAEKHADEMRAKGLVEHDGRWVTPEEKDALRKGLVKDGEEWVTEEEYHQRRGEQLVDGEWVRIGEKEAKAWLQELKAARLRVTYTWSANVDAYSDVKTGHTMRVIKGAEAAFKVFRSTLRPDAQEFPTGVRARVRLHLFNKLPAYARFAKFFDGKERCSELVKGWVNAVRRQHSFWWVDPVGVVGAYKFPNTPRTFVSNAVHSLGLILLTRYRFNYSFPRQWLLEGFAYYLELEALGYTDTFSLSRGGTGAAAAAGRPVWADSDEWKGALKTLVAEGRDPPMKRIVRMQAGQMHYLELVKSWSIVECLIRLDPEKFVAFIDADKDRDKTTEDALAEVYGWSWRELDRVWRAYVTAGFTHDPPQPEGEGAE